MIFTYLLCGIVGIATIIDIIKLITKKYDMCVIGGSKHTNGDSFEDNFATNSSSRFIDDGTVITEKEEEIEQPVTANDFLNSIDNGVNDNLSAETSLIDSNDVVDISYASNRIFKFILRIKSAINTSEPFKTVTKNRFLSL